MSKMILFFDTYITNKPLVKSFVVGNHELRGNTPSYAMPKKIDIAKYSLASYAPYPWRKVIIRYGFDKNHSKSQKDEFHKYIKNLYPKAKIISSRGPTLIQKDYLPIVNYIKQEKIRWIFYCPNNDHPMMCSSYQPLHDGLEIADKYYKNHQFVSVVYSHFSEFVRMGFSDSKFHQRYAKDASIIETGEKANVFLRNDGDNSAIQIVSDKLFIYWFNSQDLKEFPLMRSEDIRQHFLTHDQIMIVPKKPICEHFDGYSHTLGGVNEIKPDKIPPLFIPKGFFESNINIAFGYENYKKGFTNINPAATRYVFEDKINGVELKKTLSELPYFWRGRVGKILINPEIDWGQIEQGEKKQQIILANPWSEVSEKKPLKKSWLSILNRTSEDGNVQINKDLLIDQEKLARLGLKNQIIPLKLHIGCGPRILKGWINIDLMYEPFERYLQYYTNTHYPPNVRGGRSSFYAFNIVSGPLPLPDNSVEVVFHEDFIEHLNQKEQILFLAEMRRVLKPGGIHRINTPNLIPSMKERSIFSLGHVGVYKPEWEKHVHKNVLTPKILEEIALLVGYKKVLFSTKNKSTAHDLPLEYRPDPTDRPEEGNIFADLVK